MAIATSDNLLKQPISSRGERILQDNISEGENILISLRGSFGQALIATEKRLYILKWGFQAGSLFGGRCLAFDYKNITGVTITKNFSTGMIEIISAGTQEKKLTNTTAIKADNAVAFYRKSFDSFQKASNFIRELINQAHNK